MSNDGGAGQVRVNVQWVHDNVAVPAPVNQIQILGGPSALQSPDPDTYLVTFGHVTPPALPSFANQDEADAYSQQAIALVVPVARLTFTPARLREVYNAIGVVLEADNLP